MGINFRESTFSEVKKGIYFREFSQNSRNSRNFLPAKISSLKVVLIVINILKLFAILFKNDFIKVPILKLSFYFASLGFGRGGGGGRGFRGKALSMKDFLVYSAVSRVTNTVSGRLVITFRFCKTMMVW